MNSVLATDNIIKQTSSRVGGLESISAVLKSGLLMCLFLLTFSSSFVPFLLRKAATEAVPEGRRRYFALVFGFLSCFGGGVFLATCLLDLLPNTHNKLNSAFEELNVVDSFPFGEFLVAIGFFLVLFLEQIALWWKELTGKYFNVKDGEEENMGNSETAERGRGRQTNNGAGDIERPRRRIPPLLRSIEAEPLLTAEDNTQDRSEWLTNSVHFDPTAHSIFRTMILVFALSLHAVFEGLALGLQTELGLTLQIFTALCIHKVVLAFSLGLRLVQNRLTICIVVLCCLIFSIMAPLGGFLGLAITECVNKKYSDMVSGCLQGIACGTFLYVTAFEILPHELNEAGHRLVKLLMLVLGYAVICLFLLIYPDK